MAKSNKHCCRHCRHNEGRPDLTIWVKFGTALSWISRLVWLLWLATRDHS